MVCLFYAVIFGRKRGRERERGEGGVIMQPQIARTVSLAQINMLYKGPLMSTCDLT